MRDDGNVVSDNLGACSHTQNDPCNHVTILHIITAILSWLVQNCDMIGSLESKLERNNFHKVCIICSEFFFMQCVLGSVTTWSCTSEVCVVQVTNVMNKLEFWTHQYWLFANWTLKKKMKCNVDQNTKNIIQGNVSEKVACKMLTIFVSRSQYLVRIPLGGDLGN